MKKRRVLYDVDTGIAMAIRAITKSKGKYLNVRLAAAVVGVSRPTVAGWLRVGRVDPERVPAAVLERLIEKSGYPREQLVNRVRIRMAK